MAAAPPKTPAETPAAPPPRARGKVVIVTGASSATGIGRAAALRFAESGARAVYLCDADGSLLESLRGDMAAALPGVAVHARRFDAAGEASVRAVVDDALRRYGRLDIFFAKAGVAGRRAVFTDVAADDFMAVLRTNALSVFLAAKHAAPAMRRTSVDKPAPGGSIIATASVAGLRANSGPMPYSASKAAVGTAIVPSLYHLTIAAYMFAGRLSSRRRTAARHFPVPLLS